MYGSQRIKDLQQGLQALRCFLGNTFVEEEDPMYLALFTNFEPVTFEHAIQFDTCIKAMKE